MKLLIVAVCSFITIISVAQTKTLSKPVYTTGLHYEMRDTFTYVAVPQGETIQGYILQNVLGRPVHHIKGKSTHDALFKLPHLPEGHYLLMMECEAAYYCRRVYIR